LEGTKLLPMTGAESLVMTHRRDDRFPVVIDCTATLLPANIPNMESWMKETARWTPWTLPR
ncbi:MAG: hypothetical protein N2C14_04005, partial [Planctomycetales bacterium]